MINKIRLFIKAIHNNIYIDEYVNNLFSLKKNYYIVNPTKFLIYKKKYSSIFHFIYFSFIVFSPLLSVIKITFDFFKAVQLKFQCPIIDISSIGFSDNLILYTDEHVKFTIDKINLKNFCIITKPFNKFTLEEDRYALVISSLSLVSYTDLMKNYITSLISIFAVVYNYGYINALYSMVSYEWFIMYDILDKKYITDSKNVFFSNQKDRWAILYDRKYKNSKVLVQHGTNIIKEFSSEKIRPFFKYLATYNSFAFQMPIRYNHIDKLVAFTQEEADHIIAGEFNVAPKSTELIGYNIIINKIERVDNRKVLLLIGNVNIFYEQEKIIINEIDHKKYKLLIKSHPNSSEEMCKNVYGEDSIISFNPDADLVISYASTLAYEYMSLNYKVFIYKDKVDVRKTVEIINNY